MIAWRREVAGRAAVSAAWSAPITGVLRGRPCEDTPVVCFTQSGSSGAERAADDDSELGHHRIADNVHEFRARRG